MKLQNQLRQTIEFIRTKVDMQPQVGIILGTGLGALAESLEGAISIDYDEIPHFPVATVEQHKGKLHFGQLNGRFVVVMQGRFHYYEGYSMKEVTYPVRIMKLLGVQALFISNIAGSVCAELNVGDLMLIEDHIYLQYENPLTGSNLDEMGPRWPDMHEPYSQELIERALRIAEKENLPCKTGVYASVPGPNLETKAEYRYLKIIGANAVGMSTAPEVIVAVHCGMKVFAVSVITDKNYPAEAVKKLDISEIIATAATAEPQLVSLFKKLINSPLN